MSYEQKFIHIFNSFYLQLKIYLPLFCFDLKLMVYLLLFRFSMRSFFKQKLGFEVFLGLTENLKGFSFSSFYFFLLLFLLSWILSLPHVKTWTYDHTYCENYSEIVCLNLNWSIKIGASPCKSVYTKTNGTPMMLWSSAQGKQHNMQ